MLVAKRRELTIRPQGIVLVGRLGLQVGLRERSSLHLREDVRWRGIVLVLTLILWWLWIELCRPSYHTRETCRI